MSSGSAFAQPDVKAKAATHTQKEKKRNLLLTSREMNKTDVLFISLQSRGSPFTNQL
jgi:hypothetical protein